MANVQKVVEPTLNPLPNTPAAKLPTAKTLKNVLGTFESHGSKWAMKAPVGFKKMVPLKIIQVQKNPSNSGAGDVENIKAYVLKGDRVVFEKTGGMANLHQWLGPVFYTSLPRDVRPGVAINPMPNR